MPAIELNLDGLVGPTHHYGGLGLGNVASQRHRHEVSDPRGAALEGIAKMRLLVALGIPQAVLPPQERPLVAALRRLGFVGDDARVLASAARESPELLSAASSTSSMWAANAASVSPAADTTDGRVHLTPANLVSQFHRSLEPPTTATVLKRIFPDHDYFAHHAPLPAALPFADEGAANQMRLCPTHGEPGIEAFVFGRDGETRPGGRIPARQSLAASQAVARLHGVAADRRLFLRQSEAAIDAGVFHNDVIAVANENVLLVHERAYAEGTAALHAIRAAYARVCGPGLVVIEVPEREVSLADAVDTYLFNSQLLTLPTGGMALVCPAECRSHAATSRWLDALLAAGGPIATVHPVEVGQSMR
ncbi:MAG: N-succinylarginine dihydrolase, partial [Planctomycetota bacterium]